MTPERESAIREYAEGTPSGSHLRELLAALDTARAELREVARAMLVERETIELTPKHEQEIRKRTEGYKRARGAKNHPMCGQCQDDREALLGAFDGVRLTHQSHRDEVATWKEFHNQAVEHLKKAERENAVLREALEYIWRRGYTGAAFVAERALTGKPLTKDELA